MSWRNLSRIGWIMVVAGCGTTDPDPSPSAGGGAGAPAGTGGQAPAGMGQAGSDAAAGVGGGASAGANSDAQTGGAGGGGGLGSAGEDNGGAAGAAGGEAVGGAAGNSVGGSSGTDSAGGAGEAGAGGAPEPEITYEPISADVFDEMPLFEGNPPNFKANAPAETVNGQGSISNVSVPTIRRFAMDDSKRTGYGYIVFPGGGYTGLDMDTHATRLAERVGPQGVAVFAVKYRVGDGSTDAPRDALLDAKRAVRIVKHNAAHWGVDVEHLGIVGYSAGSHVVLNLAANFDEGDPNSADPIETHDSRPAFVGSMSTWAFYRPESPFTFPDGVPPVYFCHAEDDTIAPIALARTVDMQVSAKGAETNLDIYRSGGHSTCHPGDASMEGRNWPDKLLPWVQSILE